MNLSGLGTNPWALPSDAAGGAHELAVRPGQSAGYGASQGDMPWGQAAALGPHRSLLSQQRLGGACGHAGAAEALAQRRNVVDDFRLLEVAAACLRGLHGEGQLGNAWLASDRIGSDQIRSDADVDVCLQSQSVPLARLCLIACPSLRSALSLSDSCIAWRRGILHVLLPLPCLRSCCLNDSCNCK
jgi:hypothetical protein